MDLLSTYMSGGFVQCVNTAAGSKILTGSAADQADLVRKNHRKEAFGFLAIQRLV